MHLTVDGDYPDQGMTLAETASLMLEFGCLIAFDGGGGGDSVDVMNGQVMSQPDDDLNGLRYERKVPQTILVYAQGVNTMNGLAKEKTGNSPVVRKTPSRYGVEVARKPAGWETEFTEKVPVQKQGTADKDGEMWLKLPDGNFTNWKLFNGGVLTEMFSILREPTVDEPTEPPAASLPTIEIFVDAGDQYTVETTPGSGLIKLVPK